MKRTEQTNINENNFFINTFANFTECEKPKGEPDYESASGSCYWYTDQGVVRVADHWGKEIATCDWYLDGENKNDYTYRAGFCAWSDFQEREFEVCLRGKTFSAAAKAERLQNGKCCKWLDLTASSFARGFAEFDGRKIKNTTYFTPFGLNFDELEVM